MPHVGIELGPAKFCQYAGYSSIARDQQELKNTGNENAPCRRVTGGRKESRKRQRNNQRQVKQDRRGSGCSEPLQRIEDPAVERHQRHQQQIGKCDAGQFDSERETAGVVREAGRQYLDHRRREQQRNRKQNNLARKQQGEDAVREYSGAGGSAAFPYARISGDERSVERPFGEYGAEVVGQSQSHEEGVGHGPGAENGGQDDIAGKAGRTREEREAADSQNPINHQGKSLPEGVNTADRYLSPTRR